MTRPAGMDGAATILRLNHLSGYRKDRSLVETVLSELCVEQGFCLEPEQQARMLQMSTDDLDAFANAIFAAEGSRSRTTVTSGAACALILADGSVRRAN